MHLRIRTATIDDASAVDELLAAYARARSTRLPGVGQGVQRLSRTDSPAAAVLDGERLVGFGHFWSHGDRVRCFARVHPEATGHGVSTLLLDRLERLADETGAAAFDVVQPDGDTTAADLLTGRGYAPICYVLQMEMALDGYHRPGTPLPDDVRLVNYDETADADGVFAAFQAANPDNPTTAADWWADMCDNPAMPYEPALWFVARVGDEIVGYALGARHERESGPVGYVAEVGVRPGRRGQGIALAALTEVIAAFAAAGLPTATLNVDADNVTGALALYRKAGMHAVPQFTEWSKPLR